MGIPAETFATDALFQPLKLGRIEVANRMAMAPLTRSRANDALEPTDMVVEYYRQRAGVGLIIAEARRSLPPPRATPIPPASTRPHRSPPGSR
jgi:N-ethylmaleimide reductase